MQNQEQQELVKQDKQIQIQPKPKNTDPYKDLPYDKLLKQVHYLDIKNRQLTSRIVQLQPYKQRQVKVPPNQKQAFIFGKFKTKRYALKIAYVGINYNGMAIQPSTDNTIEAFIFRCMHGLSLIKDKVPGNDYTRAGRTDKGVSAYGNVIALNLRTSIQINQDLQKQKVIRTKDHKNGRLDYAKMLNSILPEDIRIMAVKEVDDHFNARHRCIEREYKYFFSKNHLDMQKMSIAIKKFEGTHYFVNFCKIDVTSTIQYERTIKKATIEKVTQNIFQLQKDERNQIYYFHFIGNSFLWHQIRFMATILFLIGSGKESSQIIEDLFDIEKYPNKPNYPVAPQYPLILEDCRYNDLTFEVQKEEAINFYSTFNDIIMKNILELTLYINCMELVKNLIYTNLKIDEEELIKSSIEQEKKFLKKKYKKLQFQKSTCINIKEAISNLKGKRLQLYQKKNKKQQEYQNRVKQIKNFEEEDFNQ